MNTGHNCKRQKGMEMKSSTWCNLKTVHFRNVHGVGGFLVGAQINLQNLGRRAGGTDPSTYLCITKGALLCCTSESQLFQCFLIFILIGVT